MSRAPAWGFSFYGALAPVLLHEPDSQQLYRCFVEAVIQNERWNPLRDPFDSHQSIDVLLAGMPTSFGVKSQELIETLEVLIQPLCISTKNELHPEKTGAFDNRAHATGSL